MSLTSQALDDAFERMATAPIELSNGFVSHAPMACEALAAMDRDDDIDAWARGAARLPGAPVEPVPPARDFDPDRALGDHRRLPEWIGYFRLHLLDGDWRPVVSRWVPRLLPALDVMLFHAAIRAGHAVRAVDAVDTAPRRAELARALGWWAARFHPGQRVTDALSAAESVAADSAAVAGADAARLYLAHPTIYELHGVTGTMAVELLAPHVPPEAAAAGVAQARAELVAISGGARSNADAPDTLVVGIPDEELAKAAAASRDPHQVKLVEACLRGFRATSDPAFRAAAELVTRFEYSPQ